MPYTLKADEFEAMQFDGTNHEALRQWMSQYLMWPTYALTVYANGDRALVMNNMSEILFRLEPGMYVVICSKNHSGSAKAVTWSYDLESFNTL